MMKAKRSPVDLSDHQPRSAGDMQTLAEARLRRASVRVTKARVKVFMALLHANRAFSHTEVQDTFADMDRVTLYRALDCLIEAGLAHRIAGDDRIFRYSVAGDGTFGTRSLQSPQHQHGHFKCTRCARIFCLENIGGHDASDASAETIGHGAMLRRQLQRELQHSLGKGFRGHDIELTIKGWCADCGTEISTT